MLILGAGTALSSNVVRSLKAGDPGLFIVGGYYDRFVLKKSTAERNYVVPLAPMVPHTRRHRLLRGHPGQEPAAGT